MQLCIYWVQEWHTDHTKDRVCRRHLDFVLRVAGLLECKLEEDFAPPHREGRLSQNAGSKPVKNRLPGGIIREASRLMSCIGLDCWT